ncbi:TonB-dependent receptor [Glycocaulis alkaliphilus]|uniref:TonB-dependent receptor n=1 Tax=Glycocaulis alkaliphilus TaxID=1434191 RepID=A0A3T0EC23_9PROT|nr:TonB-dependent receptor [Glycocaulis alkaliphilus]AZU04758.1 TonB-dependent receptor [Glycocaulis alkaliphilus]GGB67874.1 TonB-dependent receptor [Glycocaulis alkaliphilus]
MKHARTSLMLAASVSVLAAASSGALADTLADEVETITVTSSALAVSRDSVTGSVDVLDRDDLIRDLSGNIAQTLERLPGVSTTFFGPASGRPVIRGLGSERVRVLINGLDGLDASSSSPDHAVAVDVLGSTGVEVLRGPAAIGFGGGAIGGVVNVFDGRIPETMPENPVFGEVYLGATTGNEGREGFVRGGFVWGELVAQGEFQRRQAGVYDIPGFAESARLRAMEDHDHDHDDHDDDDHDHDHDDEAFGFAPDTDYVFEAGSLGASIVGNWGFVGIGFKRTEAEYGIPGHVHPHHDDHDDDHDDDDHDHDHEHDHEHAPRLVLEQSRVDLRGEIALNGFFNRVRWSLAYADYVHAEIEDDEQTIFDKEGFEARVELRHGHGNQRQGAWGATALTQDFEATGDEAFIEAVTTQDFGLFATERWDFDSWGVEIGARADTRELTAQSANRRFNTVSASGAVFLRPAEGWFLAGTLSRSERAPSDVEVYADGPHLATQAYEVGNLDLSTEVAWSIEGTARYTSAGGLSAEASVFYADYDGFIELFPTGAEEDGLPVLEFRQEDARLYGFEARVSAPLFALSGFDFTGEASIDYVRGEIDGGGNLPRISPMSGALSVTADNGPLSLRTEARFVSEQTRVFENELPTDGYTLLNADARWRPFAERDVQLIFAVRNITDEEARIHSSFLKDYIPLPGRNVRVALATRF